MDRAPLRMKAWPELIGSGADRAGMRPIRGRRRAVGRGALSQKDDYTASARETTLTRHATAPPGPHSSTLERGRGGWGRREEPVPRAQHMGNGLQPLLSIRTGPVSLSLARWPASSQRSYTTA
ncbi:hypothetical protein AAFF_G00166110 [Aldrovandia affinis]|uniref:Uncharacterized protein n=1 Tax=Aldrovandia affinis TaxID=143900 RepID=A0AAD7W782_9TELE|nr:hypothetical protein AAFF_G00166110 [Aldrovandia affinis]